MVEREGWQAYDCLGWSYRYIQAVSRILVRENTIIDRSTKRETSWYWGYIIAQVLNETYIVGHFIKQRLSSLYWCSNTWWLVQIRFWKFCRKFSHSLWVCVLIYLINVLTGNHYALPYVRFVSYLSINISSNSKIWAPYMYVFIQYVRSDICVSFLTCAIVKGLHIQYFLLQAVLRRSNICAFCVSIRALWSIFALVFNMLYQYSLSAPIYALLTFNISSFFW